MSAITDNLHKLKQELPQHVTLVVVSKTHPAEKVQEIYDTGHRIFGENKVQELVGKYEQLPNDIEWHLIGHLQTNKVKYIAPFVSLIHSVDSLRLLNEIDRAGKKNNRSINCLLQVYIAREETKFGLSFEECTALITSPEFTSLNNVKIVGLMGMASNTEDREVIRKEFRSLKNYFEKVRSEYLKDIEVLSMGMSSDYRIAIEEGSTTIRVGSTIFGERNYNR
jgi:PLP dependent protein